MEIDLCPHCGNNHEGSCTTETIYFIYHPEPSELVTEVELVGSWYQWQNKEKMSPKENEKGEVFFQLGLTLPVGTYEYKYLVNGCWVVDETATVIRNDFDTLNNQITVYPKKTFVEMAMKNDIKITSNITVDGLKIVGSWDDWKEETPMEKTFNSLKNCEENVVHLRLVPNTSYEFKFKIGKQYLIDQKYPTVVNQLGTQNNRIITYSERIETPKGWKAKQSYTSHKNITGKTFEWQRIPADSELPYQKVEGHSLCVIGDYIYIFGGKSRNEFVNTLIKINIHQFSNAIVEEVVPNGRAFHAVASYGNKMIIYGGISNTILDDYHSFNTAEGTWTTTPKILGENPVKKQKESCVLYEMMLVFFGGYNCTADFEYETFYNEISVLDIEHMKWVHGIKTEGPRPKGRYAHTATLIGSEMYIFGGLTSSASQQDNTPTKASHITKQHNLNDIWKINLERVNSLIWTEFNSKGKVPTARHGHSMNVICDLIIIFGGRNDKFELLNDVSVFDTKSEQWIFPIIHGQIPRPRYNHGATVVQSDYLAVFGGRTKDQKANKNFYMLKPQEFQSNLDIEEEDDFD